MKQLFLILSIFVSCNLFAEFQSQKDTLTKKYLDAKNNYFESIKSKDASSFTKSVQELNSVGQSIISANAPLIQAMRNYVNSPYHKNDLNMKTSLQELENVNKKISEFILPTEITVEGNRKIDTYIDVLKNSISNHDLGCNRANISHL